MKSKKLTREKLDLFLQKQSSTARTLDIGAGDKYYGKHFPNRVIVDIDEKRQPDIVASVYDLPFENNEFEIILCTEVLEHLVEPQKAISEMKRVLKPGGKLVLSTRFIFPIHDAPGDFFRYTKYGLTELFKDWQIESLIEERESLETIAVLLQRLIFQVKFRYNKIFKLILILLMKFFLLTNRLTRKEYGDIKQTYPEKNILTSGYYLVAIKNKDNE